MYETYLHRTSKDFLAFARERLSRSKRVGDMVGWRGAINGLKLDRDLALLYQLEETDSGWAVTDMHMLLWGAGGTLRKDVCRIGRFWKADGAELWNPDGNILWHASLMYGGRTDLPFVVTNVWTKEAFDKHAEGGNFEMTFSGLGTWMECLNGRSVIRFYSGNPVEMARRERNDPTIDHEDMDMSELRSLNPGHDKKEPALAEFTGVVDACETVRIGEEKCYRIRLWSGPAESSGSFPWNLLIASNRIDGRYVPRVGDIVHGNAVMFGTFHGEAQPEPTLFEGREFLDKDRTPSEGESDVGAGDVAAADEETNVEKSETEREGSPCKKEWEYQPRKPAHYPDVADHGKGLAADVAGALPKFVTYADYKRAMKGELRPIREPSRKELRRILGSIDYVITNDCNRHVFASVFESIGIRHHVTDVATGERHLWCCLPSGFDHEHFLTNLLVALAPSGDVLRYSFYMGAWDWRRMYHGLSLQVNFQKDKNLVWCEKMSEVVVAIDRMVKDDYLIATELGHTVMVQAYCDAVCGDRQEFTVEWQAHYLPWQFTTHGVSADDLKKVLETFDANGLEAVETLLDWHWCKMKCNT